MPTRTVIVLSVVTLVLGIGAYIAINPHTAIGLAQLLAAIARIIRAIVGNPTKPNPDPDADASPTKPARRSVRRGRTRHNRPST